MLRFIVNAEKASGILSGAQNAATGAAGASGPSVDPERAHLLSGDDDVVPAEITLREGELRFRARAGGMTAAAACVLHAAGAMGELMLPTCLLALRDEPYHLTVELARYQIRSFIVKAEEWQLFDHERATEARALWEEARQLLTSALTAVGTEAVERFAGQALETGISACDRLAMTHADLFLQRRFAQRAASSRTLGVVIRPEREGKVLREIVGENFDVVALPVRWRDLETSEGSYAWAPLDRWMQWAREQKKPVVAGPLLDLSAEAIPAWAGVFRHDFEAFREMLYNHMVRVVDRYRGAVAMWNVAAGINTNEAMELNVTQMLSLVRTARQVVRERHRGAKMMLEIRQPFGEHLALRPGAVAPMTFYERVVGEGMAFDALGVQVLAGISSRGRGTRDLLQVSAMLDRFLPLETPVIVSALGAPSRTIDERGGWWRRPWSDDAQKQWISHLFHVAMSKPMVESVFWSDLYDHAAGNLPGAGLITEDGAAKPSLSRLVGIRRRLRRPLGTQALTEQEADA